MIEMYKGVANSPETTITNEINNTDTLIYVLDETRIPAELPNLMVLGTGTSAETVKVLSIDSNIITVERGFQGVAKAWNAGTIIARNFTEYDYNALVENIKENDTKVGPLASLLTLIKTSIVAAINSLKGEVDAHKAERVQEIATASRTISITGIQTLTFQNKIKAVNIMAFIEGTKIQSVGVFDTTYQCLRAEDSNGETTFHQNIAILLKQNGGVDMIQGTLAIDGKELKILWATAAGNPVGEVSLVITAYYHGGEN